MRRGPRYATQGHGGCASLRPWRPDARGMAGRRPLLDRCARPAHPAPPIHSPWRVNAQPAPERPAPAAALTLHCTPRACSGRFPGSSRGQSDFLAAAPRSPPLPSRQLQRGASARCWRPPQVSAMSLSVPAPTAALLRHPQHPWEGEPRSVFDLSGCVGPERANCPRTPYNPTCTFEDNL
jgi:hypothetical protein